MEPTISIEVITPSIAERWLVHNASFQRNVRQSAVNRYAQAMRDGQWRLTGEPIIVADDKVINGQHRLLACVLAGVPFTTAVMRTSDTSVYEVVDSGVKRSDADALGLDGIRYAKNAAASARLVLAYEAGAPMDSSKISALALRHVVLSEVREHREAYERAATVADHGKKVGFNQTALSAALILLGRRAPDAEQWIMSAIRGAELKLGDPRLALGRWSVMNRGAKNTLHLSAIIRARNAHVEGRTLRIIAPWRKGEPFPRLIEDAEFAIQT